MKLYSILVFFAIFCLLHSVSSTKLIKKLLKAKFFLKRGFGGKGGGNQAMVHFVIPLLPPLGGLMGGGLRGVNSNSQHDGHSFFQRGPGHRRGNFLFPPHNDNNQDCQQQQQLLQMFQHQQQQQQRQQLLQQTPINQKQSFYLPEIEQQALESSMHHQHQDKLRVDPKHATEGIKGRAQAEQIKQHKLTQRKSISKTGKPESGWTEPMIIMMDIDHHHQAKETDKTSPKQEEHSYGPLSMPLENGNQLYNGQMDTEDISSERDDHQQQPQPFLVSDGMKS